MTDTSSWDPDGHSVLLPRGKDRPLHLGLNWHEGPSVPCSGSCSSGASAWTQPLLDLTGLFLASGHSAPQGQVWGGGEMQDVHSGEGDHCGNTVPRSSEAIAVCREQIESSSYSFISKRTPGGLVSVSDPPALRPMLTQEGLFLSLEGRDLGVAGGVSCCPRSPLLSPLGL